MISYIGKLYAVVWLRARRLGACPVGSPDCGLVTTRAYRIIGTTGGSAGACTSMWILLHDDQADPQSSDPVLCESTRVVAAAVHNGQTSIDPKVIEPWLGPNVLQHRMIHLSVGEPSLQQALDNYEKHRQPIRIIPPANF